VKKVFVRKNSRVRESEKKHQLIRKKEIDLYLPGGWRRGEKKKNVPVKCGA